MSGGVFVTEGDVLCSSFNNIAHNEPPNTASEAALAGFRRRHPATLPRPSLHPQSAPATVATPEPPATKKKRVRTKKLKKDTTAAELGVPDVTPDATAEAAKKKIATASASNNLKMLNEGLEMLIQVGVGFV